MSNVQAWEAREILLAEDQGLMDLVLPVLGGDLDDAGLVAAARDLSWQTATPEEQWAIVTNENR